MTDLLPLAVYIFVMSITPGPNNVMATASGALFGYRRTIPQMLGISIGCCVQTLMVALGLGFVFVRYPALHQWLSWAGIAYLAYLGWRLVASGMSESEAVERAAPISFIEAALFQFLNPKAWMIAVTTATVFFPHDLPLLIGSLAIVAVLFVVNYPCVSVWVLFGTAIGRILTDAFRRRVFNAILGTALVLTGFAMAFL
jgi:threonine/homoserine/homoserine lactone efflux protein